MTKILLLLATFFLIAIFYISIQPPAVLDTYFHLAVGRQVAQTGQIPKVDNFIYSQGNHVYTSNVWLSGLIFYLFVNFFGIGGMLVLKVALISITIYFLYRALALFTQDEFKIGTFLLFAAYMLAFRFNSRPEMISLALLSIVNFCCLYYFTKKKITGFTYGLPLIFLAWPNIHGLAIVGLALLVFFGFLYIFELKFMKIKRENFTILMVLFGLSLFAAGLQYERVLAFLNAGRFSGFVLEWASLAQRLHPTGDFSFLGLPTSDIFIYMAIVAAYLLLFLASIILGAKSEKHNFGFYLVGIFYGALLLYPFKYFRLIQTSLLLSLPVLAYYLGLYEQKVNYKIIYKALFFILALFLIVCTIQNHLYGSEYETGRLTYPFGSEKFIEANLASRRIFTVGLWDDYYLWTLPQVKTYSDILMDTKTKKTIDTGKIMHNPSDAALTLIKKYNVDTVINTQSWLSLQNSTPVYKLQNWKLVYLDGTFIIYARNDVIKRQPLDLSLIHPEYTSALKFKKDDEKGAMEQIRSLLAYDPKNDFARAQLIIYYLTDGKNFTAAKDLAQQSAKLFPKNPWFDFYLAISYDALKDCPKVVESAKAAISKGHRDEAINESFISSIANCK